MDGSNTCPAQYEAAMEVLGKKWTALILRPLMEGPCRFSDMSAYVSGLSDRLLSQRLQELEERGILERRVYDERPVRVQYALTEKGRDLRGVLEAIACWADRWEMAPTNATADLLQGD
jgi:DNA-binding HxlR family transcriptional regulator